MNASGQPTRYKPEYRELAHNYCLLGATNEELGGFFDVTRRTIDNWIANVPERAEVSDDGVDDIALLDAAGERARFE